MRINREREGFERTHLLIGDDTFRLAKPSRYRSLILAAAFGHRQSTTNRFSVDFCGRPIEAVPASLFLNARLGTLSFMHHEQTVTVTASELADFVFCPHSRFLKRQGTALTAAAEQHLQEGLEWQDRKDAQIQPALIAQRQAQRSSQHAKLALSLLLILLGVVLLYLLSSFSHSRF